MSYLYENFRDNLYLEIIYKVLIFIAVVSNGNQTTSVTPIDTEITHCSNPITTKDEIHQSSIEDFGKQQEQYC